MARSIEVSDEFYEWLKSQATPLEDTTVTVADRMMSALRGTQQNGEGYLPQMPVPSTAPTLLRASNGTRPKLNARELRTRGVTHFEVAGQKPSWNGKTAHPRAYLEGMLGNRLATFKYFERDSPYGDAASRVILKIGASDFKSKVHFGSGEWTTMANFVADFIAGKI